MEHVPHTFKDLQVFLQRVIQDSLFLFVFFKSNVPEKDNVNFVFLVAILAFFEGLVLQGFWSR